MHLNTSRSHSFVRQRERGVEPSLDRNGLAKTVLFFQIHPWKPFAKSFRIFG